MKNIKFKKVLFMLVLSPLVLASCSKATTDPQNPMVSLSVLNRDVFIVGDSIFFSLEANDNDGLHEINLDIYDSNDLESPIENYNEHSHGKTFDKEYGWKIESFTITNYTAILTASDHALNIGRDTVGFSVTVDIVSK